VDSYLMMDPWCAMRQHAIPFWLMSGAEPSAASLARFLDRQPRYRDIDMLLFSPGTASIGMAPLARWQGLLDRAMHEGAFVGVDTERYPHDFAALARFDSALRARAPLFSPPPALSVEKVIGGIERYGARHGVTLHKLN